LNNKDFEMLALALKEARPYMDCFVDWIYIVSKIQLAILNEYPNFDFKKFRKLTTIDER
jgi:hypothetical protein